MRALIGLLIGWFVAASLPVAAQSFPSKPLRFVVPFPGGFSDVLARQIGARMGDASLSIDSAAIAQNGQVNEPNSMSAISLFHSSLICTLLPEARSSSGNEGARIVTFGACTAKSLNSFGEATKTL
jgi:hypothetical protein